MLGLFFREAGPFADPFMVDEDGDAEELAVVGPLFADDLVGGGLLEPLLGEVLQLGLGVDGGLLEHPFDLFAEVPEEELPGGFNAAVEVDRPHDRFEEVGEDRVAPPSVVHPLPFAEEEVGVEVETVDIVGAGGGGDELGAHQGEVAFRLVWVPFVEVFGDEKAEDGIAEELEPLVVVARDFAMFVDERAVGEGEGEERFISEGIAELRLNRPNILKELFNWIHGRGV